MISVDHITKNYGIVRALNDLTIEISRGEVLGLLGPNGAGKTTLMKILAGLLEPDSGEIRVAGKSVCDDKNALKERLGYFGENNPLYEEMLVQEYLEFVSRLRPTKGSQSRDAMMKRIVELTSIESVFFRPIQELSKGYRQRVGLAAAMMNDPEILILDEPTEGLDPNQRVDIRSLISELGKNRTIIVSTHVLSEVASLCRRLVIIDRGKLIVQGTIEELAGKISQSQEIVVEAEGVMIPEAFLEIPGIARVIEKENHAGRIRCVLAVDHEKNPEAEIFKLAVAKGWVLSELHRKRVNLEDIFRQLTRSNFHASS